MDSKNLFPRVNFLEASALFLLLLILSATMAQAQVLYGTISGNVTDSSGAVVAGAQVVVLEVRTGVSQTATTDSNGLYRITALLPGTYKVTISASGFVTLETPKTVSANEIARQDAQLKVGSTTENITVSTEAPLLQTDKADVHTDLTAQQIENLPTDGSQGRNFQSLLRTIPGVGLTAETNSLAGNPQRAINANVNGQSNQTVNTRIDGAQNAYPWLPANVAYVPPADSIEMVNVSTNSFDAEQGMAGGAAVNVQIKSGTNQFHGSAHIFHTDQSLAARNYFQTDPTIFPKKNRNNQYQWGGTFGGPIKKEKLFFFLRLRAHNPAATGRSGYANAANGGNGNRRFSRSAGKPDYLRSHDWRRARCEQKAGFLQRRIECHLSEPDRFRRVENGHVASA